MKEKVPVTRSSSGRCFRKMHLVPAGTPGGAFHVLPASNVEKKRQLIEHLDGGW